MTRITPATTLVKRPVPSSFPALTKILPMLALLLAAALAGGCAGNPAPAAAPVETSGEPASETSGELPVTTGQSSTDPSLASESTPPPAPAPSTDSATLALLNQSERAAQSGAIGDAMAYAERAVRIEPERADLWIRLAALQLEDGNPTAAIQYASKALALAKHRMDWRRDAWLVIADAKEAQGDSERAREIRNEWRSARG